MATRPRGKNNFNTKMTEEQVRFIRKHYFKQTNQFTPIPNGMYSSRQLAEMFNVTLTNVVDIYKRKSWDWLK